MVGLWERDDVNKKPNKVVVKQQWKKLSSLEDEAMWLKLMSGTGTKHTVKMYKDVFLEKGQGAVKDFDDEGIDIGRIFLEFCEGGDFTKFIMNTYR